MFKLSRRRVEMKVYRLGPPLLPTFHRDSLTPKVKEYFEEGAFYAVGTKEFAEEWRTMGDSFKTRPLFEIELKDDAVVLFYQGWNRKEWIASEEDMTTPVYTTFNKEEGPVIDPENMQLVVRLSDVVSYCELSDVVSYCDLLKKYHDESEFITDDNGLVFRSVSINSHTDLNFGTNEEWELRKLNKGQKGDNDDI
jgi:hypothetical protein